LGNYIPTVELESPNIFDRFQASFTQILIGLGGVVFLLIAARGGTQLRPITPLSTADFVSDMRLMPLMSNTTLNFIHSTGQKFLLEKKYMSNTEAETIYPIYGQFAPVDSFQKLNVVVIALESFGKEYSQYFNAEKFDYQGFTPFLDSLAQVSLQAKYSFANGLRSAQGIAAITAGLPSLMEEQFVFSPYQSNQLDGLAAHLRREGYATAFFHGSNPGSMDFDKFANLTGFQKFYDRYGYGNQADFDGNWGIWDTPMLQFVAQKLTQTPEPFYGFFFSLTSHHPYNVPKDFEKKYPNVDDLHRSVLYADDALRQFFETAKKQPWFARTLFVISADHVGAGSFVPEYQTKVGRYNIPILFYKSNEINPQTLPTVVQQQDILPSVLDFLNYRKPFLSFGRSIFRKNKSLNIQTSSPHINYSFHFEEGLYQIQDARFALFFDGDETTGLYEYTTDIFLKNNLKDKEITDKERLEEVLKAVIQQYHKAMTTNQLVPK
jgi:phosphoglycerol transferase MdoB-like AlkP superfamily enzyme